VGRLVCDAVARRPPLSLSAQRAGVIDGGRPYVVPLNFARDGDEL